MRTLHTACSTCGAETGHRDAPALLVRCPPPRIASGSLQLCRAQADDAPPAGQQQQPRAPTPLKRASHKAHAYSATAPAQVSYQGAPDSAAETARVSSQTVHYFSYGANMACEVVLKRQVRIASRNAAFISDPTRQLVFKHRGGFATVEALPPGTRPLNPAPCSSAQGQGCVHGVLYELPHSDLKRLHTKEHGYQLTQMQVQTYDGRQVLAWVFESGPLSKLPQEVVPPECYVRKLRDGAAFNFLDPQYQAWLSGIQTVTSAGLGSEYYNTPSRYVAYSLLLVTAAIVAGYFSQHM